MNKVLSCLLPAAAIALLTATAAAAAPFNGPYIGAALGMDNYELKGSGDGDVIDGLSANGAVAGVYAGYDYAFGTKGFVGGEVSADLSGAETDVTLFGVEIKAKAKGSFGISGRIGTMVNDTTGVYGRLGWVNTKFETVVDGDTNGKTESGVTFGVGVETVLNTKTSLRAEYNIADFGDILDGLNVKNSEFKVGVSYRF
jgi:outer membrane immunogenic protein